MSQPADASFPRVHYPRGFRARRGLNWGFLGLLYTSFYMCRYNFSIANKSISEEFGFSRARDGLHHHDGALRVRLRPDYQRLAHRPDREANAPC